MSTAADTRSARADDRPVAVRVHHLGRSDYEPVWRHMQAFTQARDAQTADEFWVLEHPPVYTLGLNGKRHHVLNAGHIPVVNVDRGGQVTYHGPGQLVIYLLLDLQRRGLGVRELVRRIEQAVIELLAEYGIEAGTREGAPGVYVGDAKIAALGLRVRRGRCYHGLSFNVDMDLSPFEGINPCGYQGLAVTQLRDLGGPTDLQSVAEALTAHLAHELDSKLES
jgi:lipoyl(octanoyl) transferase